MSKSNRSPKGVLAVTNAAQPIVQQWINRFNPEAAGFESTIKNIASEFEAQAPSDLKMSEVPALAWAYMNANYA